MTEQIRRQRKETERMGIAKRHTERGREQVGMSQEGRRTMEKVLENTVHDIIPEFRQEWSPERNPAECNKILILLVNLTRD